MGIDEVGIDKVGIDEVGINRTKKLLNGHQTLLGGVWVRDYYVH